MNGWTRHAWTVAWGLALLLAGCGGGSGSGSGSTATTAEGSVDKGAVGGAILEIYAIDTTDGSLDLLESTTTSGDGSWSIDFSDPSEAGPFLVLARGGSFVDEASGGAQALALISPPTNLSDARSQTLEAIIASGVSGTIVVNLNPLTTWAARRLAEQLDSDPTALSETNVLDVHEAIALECGLGSNVDVRTLTPLDYTDAADAAAISADPDADAARLGLLHAALSQAAGDLGIDAVELVEALALDFSDGIFDGLMPVASGSQVVPYGSNPDDELPRDAGTDGLADGASDFLGGGRNASGTTTTDHQTVLTALGSLDVEPGTNTAPYFSALDDQTVEINNTGYSVAVADISAGLASADAGQTVTLSVSASPSGLLSNLSASAVSGGAATVSFDTGSSTGSTTITLTAEDDGGTPGVDSSSRTFTVTVLPTLEITTTTLPDALTQNGYLATISATGGSGSGYSWNVSSGSLPGGLNLNSATPDATLTGTPASTGTASFTLQLTDDAGLSTSQAFSLDVVAGTPLAITTSALPDGAVGVSYSGQVSATGGDGSYTFSLLSGNLQSGLSFASDGSLSGNPSVGGRVDLDIQVSDGFSNTASATLELFIPLRWLLYKGDLDTDAIDELYAADITSATPGAQVKVNGTLPTFGEVESQPVSDETFSPDGRSLVYKADQDTVGLLELYLVDMTTATPGTPVKLNDTISGVTGVDDLRWSPDSESLVYRADQNGIGVFELFLVDLSGPTPATPVRVSGSSPQGAGVADLAAIGPGEGFSFSPDGSLLAYQAEQDIAGVLELYLVDLSGTSPAAPVKLNTSFAAGQNIDDFGFSPDGNSVVYLANEEDAAKLELFLVDVSNPAMPGAPVKISGTLVSGGNVEDGFQEDLLASQNGYGFSSDGDFLAFRADADTDGVLELYLVDLSGVSPAAPVKINDALVSASSDVNTFRFSPDSDWLAYNADQDTSGADELYLVDLSTGTPGSPVKVHAALGSNGDVRSFSNGNGYNFSPDSDWIGFLVDDTTDGVNELYLVDLSTGTPGTPARAHPQLTDSSTDINSFFFHPSSDYVIFVGDATTPGTDELYLTDISSGSPAAAVTLSSTIVAGGDVQISFAGIGFSADGDRIAYRADAITDGVIEMFIIDFTMANPGAAMHVNGPVVPAGTVRNFSFQP